MSEITKLYKNAGVKKVIPDICSNYEGDCIGCIGYIKGQKPYCKSVDYPPFTPEKQLEIMKFMLHKGIYYDTDGDSYWFHLTDDIENASYKPFEEAIAEFINFLWQDLTESEQEQIRSILNG